MRRPVISCQLNFGKFFRMDDSGTGAVPHAAAPCSLVTVKRTGQSIDAPDGRSPGVPELYCRQRRDAIIIWCLRQGRDRVATDDELYRMNEPTLLDAD